MAPSPRQGKSALAPPVPLVPLVPLVPRQTFPSRRRSIAPDAGDTLSTAARWVSWTVAILTVAYTGALIAVVVWAQRIALPTNGGISPSEVLDGLVPGGLSTLLVGLAALFLATAIAWVTTAVWVACERRR